jgi:ribosome-binding factor A
MDAARARKLADRISQIVAEMLERRIKDPRLGFVTVTEARLTNDLREATVFYTVLGSDAERADTAVALASATGIIRSEVGRQIGLRHTPSLAFIADALPESAQRIEELVTQAKHADAELARSRQGARHAGDPDPYRKPAEAGREDQDDQDG